MSADKVIVVKALQALHGDAIRIRFFGHDGVYHNIFIDGGFVSTYRRTLREEVKTVIGSGEIIDRFAITHTDSDHIRGVLQFVKEFGHLDLVEQFWFNHSIFVAASGNHDGKISLAEGVRLRDLLERYGKVPNEPIVEGECYTLHGAKITILSPAARDLESFGALWREQELDHESQIATYQSDYTQTISELAQSDFEEDRKLENRASISFLFEIYGKRLLILADSHPSQLVRALGNLGHSPDKKLQVACAQVSHHGSRHNTSSELASMIDCNLFLVSANGKNRYGFPHKEALARILGHANRNLSQQVTLAFNYDNEVLRSIFSQEEEESFNIQRRFPGADDYGIVIQI